MGGSPDQDERYAAAATEFSPALERLARAYEADPDLRRDLGQEIHAALSCAGLVRTACRRRSTNWTRSGAARSGIR